MIIAGLFMPGNVPYRETMSASGCCPDMRPTGNAPSRRLSSLLRPHPIRTVRERFLGRRGCSLYIRNAFVSTISFLLDLFLIWLLVEHFAVERYMAVVAGFIVANALHYVLARIWIFRGSERGLVSGYVMFFGNALFGLGVSGLPPFSLGYVNLAGLVAIIPTSMLTAPLGVKLAHAIPQLALRWCFAGFLAITSIRMITSIF